MCLFGYNVTRFAHLDFLPFFSASSEAQVGWGLLIDSCFQVFHCVWTNTDKKILSKKINNLE